VAFHGCVTVRPTAELGAVGRPDLVFLAGMDGDAGEALSRDRKLGDWLLAAREGGAAIAAVCPSQALLAGVGLLDGRSSAVHWSLLEGFRARWPAVDWSADRVVVEEDGLYTCCGASSALDLALYMVDRLLGPEVMTECARWLLADPPRVRQNVPPPLFAASRTLDPAMTRVEAWLQAHFHEPVRLEELATRFGMSWRTFHRHFREAFGGAAQGVRPEAPLAAARRLLETGRSRSSWWRGGSGTRTRPSSGSCSSGTPGWRPRGTGRGSVSAPRVRQEPRSSGSHGLLPVASSAGACWTLVITSSRREPSAFVPVVWL
jgi:transcriptional regulator GlxA family with amidase domain